jgi:hypothetical protein
LCPNLSSPREEIVRNDWERFGSEGALEAVFFLDHLSLVSGGGEGVGWGGWVYPNGLLFQDTHHNAQQVVDQKGDEPLRQRSVEIDIDQQMDLTGQRRKVRVKRQRERDRETETSAERDRQGDRAGGANLNRRGVDDCHSQGEVVNVCTVVEEGPANRRNICTWISFNRPEDDQR